MMTTAHKHSEIGRPVRRPLWSPPGDLRLAAVAFRPQAGLRRGWLPVPGPTPGTNPKAGFGDRLGPWQRLLVLVIVLVVALLPDAAPHLVPGLAGQGPEQVLGLVLLAGTTAVTLIGLLNGRPIPHPGTGGPAEMGLAGDPQQEQQ
ncbi:hypothetical protein ACSNOI_45565 [Actinomadura kijaniata]|uniref:hypothetical protein n=1 Tax=Actinomadura kijaniata TaxID=46161 RepID=UPI003F1D3217